jgi:hypothetical protein
MTGRCIRLLIDVKESNQGGLPLTCLMWRTRKRLGRDIVLSKNIHHKEH